MIVAALIGAGAWTLAEYAIHNGVGHKLRRETQFKREHMAHHRDPRYFASTGTKAVAAVKVLAPMTALVVWVTGRNGAAFVAGFTAAYLAYEVVHRRVHTHPPRGPLGRWARRHHLYHHYRDANTNHGVTSPVWDVVFGTWRAYGQVKVPRKRAPDWMVDAEGRMLPAYAADYELIGPQRQPARSGSQL